MKPSIKYPSEPLKWPTDDEKKPDDGSDLPPPPRWNWPEID